MKKKRNKGFTLTEMIVVIAIIAILSAILIPGTTKYISKARLSADTMSIKNINDSISYIMTMDADTDNLYEIMVSLGLKPTDLTPNTKKSRCLYDLSSSRFFLIDKDDNLLIEDSLISTNKSNWVYFTDTLETVTENESKGVYANYYFTDDINTDFIFKYALQVFVDQACEYKGSLVFQFEGSGTVIVDGAFNNVTLEIPDGTFYNYTTIINLHVTSANTVINIH